MGTATICSWIFSNFSVNLRKYETFDYLLVHFCSLLVCSSSLTLSCSTSVINIPNSEHIHASDKYILSFISVRSFAEQERVNVNLPEYTVPGFQFCPEPS